MECGGCTACCVLLPIEAIHKPINTPCQYCTGEGCSIYDTKPQTCTEFMCAYAEGTNVPESIRPDNCGIIFIKRSERIFTGGLIQGAKVTDAAKGQIHSFNMQGYSVILLSVDEKKPHIMLGIGHDVEEIMKEYMEAINGNLQH